MSYSAVGCVFRLRSTKINAMSFADILLCLSAVPKDQSTYKYLKIFFGEHYGSEYYCPITFIQVYGSSLVEELKLEVRLSPNLFSSYPSLSEVIISLFSFAMSPYLLYCFVVSFVTVLFFVDFSRAFIA